MPFAVGADGRRLFAADYQSAWSGVVEIDLSTGQRTRVSRFDGSQDQVTFGAFDGRWLVFTETHSYSDLADWTLMAWDSVSGRMSVLATPATVNGQRIRGPYVIPAVLNGKAAWMQSSATGGNALHFFDLASGRDSVIGRGLVGSPVFFDRHLVWPHATRIRSTVGLAFADASTGRSQPIPSALRGVTNVTLLAGSPQSLAWVSPDLKSLWMWRPGEKAPQEILAVPNDAVQFPQIAGDLIAWRGISAAMVADTRSHAFAQINQKWGYPLAAGRELIIVSPDSNIKVDHPPLIVQALDVRSLPPLPAC